MQYIELNKTKKLSSNNIGWGIWNIEINDGVATFLADNFRGVVSFKYNEDDPVTSINTYLNKNAHFKAVLIQDIFEHFLLWIV